MDFLPIIRSFIANNAMFLTALFSMIATVGVWRVSQKMLEHQKFLQKNKIFFLKKQNEIDHIQKLIAYFAEICALSDEKWDKDRHEIKDKTISKFYYHFKILKSLSKTMSVDIEEWYLGKDARLTRVITYIMGQLHANVSGDDLKFLKCKMDSLPLEC